MPIRKKSEEVLPDETQPMFEEDEGLDEIAGLGHNNGPDMDEEEPPPPPKKPGKVKKADPEADARKSLVSFHDRIVALEDEKKELAEQIKEVYAEAKAVGFDTKALRAAIAALKKDKEERTEFEDIRDFYIEVLEDRV